MRKKQDIHRPARVARATVTVAAGAVGTAGGMVVSLYGAEGAGAGLTIAGALLMLWGLHRYGRLGADPPEASSSTAR